MDGGKTMFPLDWTLEDYADAWVKAEKEVVTRFNGRMVEELDERMFEEYLKEGGKWDKLKKEEKK